MKISPDHLEAIRRFGYTDAEAHFLYVVATHSGYFTQRQFGNLIQSKPGSAVHAFVERASGKHHLKETTLQNNCHVYQLSYKPIYKSIQKENIRNRRGHSLEFIKTRLAILDFVLEHLDDDYLEGETDKLRYFEDDLHLDRKAMPGRTYKGSNQTPDTVRYFVDKFPILFDSASAAQEPILIFTYIDPGFENVKGFRLHLEAYSAFLKRLSSFVFIYACPCANTFHAAEHTFQTLIAPRPEQQVGQVTKYFRLRVIWEAKRYEQLSNADLEFLNYAKSHLAGDAVQSLYAKWIAGGFGDGQLKQALQCLLGSERKVQFKTYKLPYSYLLFDQNSSVSRKPASNRVSLRFSSRFSGAEAGKSRE
jgi:hypothetical protein